MASTAFFNNDNDNNSQNETEKIVRFENAILSENLSDRENENV